MISLKGTESYTHASPWVGWPAVRIHLADEQTRDRDSRKNVLPHSGGGSVEWLPKPLQKNLVSHKNYGICCRDCVVQSCSVLVYLSWACWIGIQKSRALEVAVTRYLYSHLQIRMLQDKTKIDETKLIRRVARFSV